MDYVRRSSCARWCTVFPKIAHVNRGMIIYSIHKLKVKENAIVLAPESCESKQNWLSYDFFEKMCSGDGDGDDTKSLHQVMHQNTFSLKIHNSMSFAWIYMIFVLTPSHVSPTFILCTYKTIKRLCIVPGTWFDWKGAFYDFKCVFSWQIIYRWIVWLRRIQQFHFHYVICVGRQSPQENTVFLILHYDHDPVVT